MVSVATHRYQAGAKDIQRLCSDNRQCRSVTLSWILTVHVGRLDKFFLFANTTCATFGFATIAHCHLE